MRFAQLLSMSVVLLSPIAGSAAQGPDPINKCTTITKSGSYILTGNLTATGDCLIISADHVSIDLAGFLISGNGTGSGIVDKPPARKDIVIHDGSITGFSNGIFFCGFGTKEVTVYRIRANNNSQGVVLCDGSAIVRDTQANENLAQGIFVGPGSVVVNNVANDNGNLGFQVGTGSTVIGNSADENGSTGLTVIRGSTVMNNSARHNHFGLVVECPVNILGNTMTENTVNFAPTGTGCNLEHNLLVP